MVLEIGMAHQTNSTAGSVMHGRLDPLGASSNSVSEPREVPNQRQHCCTDLHGPQTL